MNPMRKFMARFKVFQALEYAISLKEQRFGEDTSSLRHIGENSVVMAAAKITHPSRVWIGKESTIHNGVFINSWGGVHIGDYVGIAANCTLLTFNHKYVHANSVPFDDKIILKPIILRDFAWLGFNVKVMPGIEIGEGAIAAFGSVVAENVPARAIVMGNPAKIVGYRSEEHFEKCKAEGRVNCHRLGDAFGGFTEVIQPITRRRYEKELIDLGMIEPVVKLGEKKSD